jgi:hypothetical protein
MIETEKAQLDVVPGHEVEREQRPAGCFRRPPPFFNSEPLGQSCGQSPRFSVIGMHG